MASLEKVFDVVKAWRKRHTECIVASGETMSNADMERYSIETVINTKENGSMANSAERAHTRKKATVHIPAHSKMENIMGKESWSTSMAISTKDNSKKGRNTVKESTHGPMVIITMDNGRMTQQMALELQ